MFFVIKNKKGFSQTTVSVNRTTSNTMSNSKYENKYTTGN